MKNILFTTVRQGNCGDEFILMGVLNLIDSLQGKTAYNPVILNKNVEVCRRLLLRDKQVNVETASGKKIGFNLEKLAYMQWPSLHDDSLADYHSLDPIDAVVFAGTPEWMGFKLAPLYRKLLDFAGPVFFLGVGFHEGLASHDGYAQCADATEQAVHRKAAVFAVRDGLLRDFMTPSLPVHHLPCPALFCAPFHKKRRRIKRIGFSLQAREGSATANYVPSETYDFARRLLAAAAREYEVEVVCHWIEDLFCLRSDLGTTVPVRYHYDARAYLDIYDRYDVVVSHRVHGAGMAASLGIPTMTVAHSLRTDTVNGFASRVITPDADVQEVLTAIRSMDIEAASDRVIAHKEATLAAYQALLSPFFPLP